MTLKQTPMTVAMLIERLKTFDPNLPVAYEKYSEYKLLDPTEIGTERLQPARVDGWVHDDFGGGPPTIEYVVFPGN